jgi:hypothetical protein
MARTSHVLPAPKCLSLRAGPSSIGLEWGNATGIRVGFPRVLLVVRVDSGSPILPRIPRSPTNSGRRTTTGYVGPLTTTRRSSTCENCSHFYGRGRPAVDRPPPSDPSHSSYCALPDPALAAERPKRNSRCFRKAHLKTCNPTHGVKLHSFTSLPGIAKKPIDCDHK